MPPDPPHKTVLTPTVELLNQTDRRDHSKIVPGWLVKIRVIGLNVFTCEMAKDHLIFGNLDTT